MENNPRKLAEKIAKAHSEKKKIAICGKLSVLKEAFDILKREGYSSLVEARE